MTFNGMEEHILKNGIILTIEDQSKILSGDLWLIRLKVTTTCFLENADDELRRFCGDRIVKTKLIERPAVHASRLDDVRKSLKESYLNSTLGYMQTPKFLKRLKEKELADQIEKLKKERRLREAGVIL
jgi:hypothetical protein